MNDNTVISAFTITQYNAVELSKIFNDQLLVVLVLAGSKSILLDGGHWYDVQAGQVLVLSPKRFITVKNTPSIDERYQALCLCYTDYRALLGAHPQANPATSSSYQIVDLPSEALTQAIKNAAKLQCAEATPDVIKSHKALEPLLWLQGLGINFNFSTEHELYSKVKNTIESDLSHQWKVVDIAQKFHYSESTLKRKLQDIGSSFSQILMNTRLDRGLFLLQSSETSISQIALECGFSTPSHFPRHLKIDLPAHLKSCAARAKFAASLLAAHPIPQTELILIQIELYLAVAYSAVTYSSPINYKRLLHNEHCPYTHTCQHIVIGRGQCRQFCPHQPRY